MPEHNFNDNSNLGWINLKDDNFELVRKSIGNMITKYDQGGLILLEHPTDFYSESSMIPLKLLIDKGYEGIYVSFQRPLENLSSWLEQNKIDVGKLLILDYSDRNDESVNQLYDQLVRSIGNLGSHRKFVFIDSLTTMALCNSDSWVNGFQDFLTNNVGKHDFENITFIVNVAKDLCNKEVVENIASIADGVIDVVNPKDDYSKDVLNSGVLT